MSTYYHIRPMEERDIPQVIDIDNEAFPTQWPRPTYSAYKNELKNRLARYIILAKPNDPSDGSGQQNSTVSSKRSWLSRLFHPKPRPTCTLPPSSIEFVIGVAGVWIMVDEAHITTIGLRNNFRRQGFGELLLIATIGLAQQLNANVVTLEVRVSNNTAQTLYKKYGFQEVGRRLHYYSDNGEHALIMTTASIKSPQFTSHFQQLQNEHRQKWQNLY